MRVLVLGGNGMLGHKVFEVLSRRFDTFATFVEVHGLWSKLPQYEKVAPERLIGGIDAMEFSSVVRAFAQARPDVVVNCIGIIKQLPQAKDSLISLSVNSLFPHQLADLCAATGARLLHMSSDCVFSGRKGNYAEDDVPDAEDLYGRTKNLGEVDTAGCLTIRTSIFGRDFLKNDAFLEWFLSQRGGRVKGYKNAIFSGFPTQVLARIMADLISDWPALSGLYQIASSPISKYDLLMKIREAMSLDVEIEPFADPPCDRSLSSTRFVASTGYRIPSWDEMLAEVAADPMPYDEWKREHVAV